MLKPLRFYSESILRSLISFLTFLLVISFWFILVVFIVKDTKRYICIHSYIPFLTQKVTYCDTAMLYMLFCILLSQRYSLFFYTLGGQYSMHGHLGCLQLSTLHLLTCVYAFSYYIYQNLVL